MFLFKIDLNGGRVGTIGIYVPFASLCYMIHSLSETLHKNCKEWKMEDKMVQHFDLHHILISFSGEIHQTNHVNLRIKSITELFFYFPYVHSIYWLQGIKSIIQSLSHNIQACVLLNVTLYSANE